MSMFIDDNNEKKMHETDEMTETFKTVVRPPFRKNCNPMREDHFHMGFKVGTNLMVLHHSHPSEVAKYVILVHIPTGHRIQICLPEAAGENAVTKAQRCEEILRKREEEGSW
jgi:hypothetical protein